MVEELEKAANNRFNEWLGSVDKATDAEVADLLAGVPAKRTEQYDPTVPSLPGLSSPSHLYQSPLPPVDEEVSKYDVESDWMDSESDETVHNERVPCQPLPTSPFRPEACAPDAQGYTKVVRGPTITVPPTTGPPIESSWVRKPTGNLKVPALMSLEVKPPTKNT